MNQTITVFECVSGTSKKGNAYNIAVVQLGEEGRVGKIFSDVPLKKGEVEVEISLAPNAEMFLAPRIKRVID